MTARQVAGKGKFGGLFTTPQRSACLSGTMKMTTLWAAVLAGIIAVFHSAGAEDTASAKTRTAIFAGGCFWCIQPAFDKANGVIKSVVGYCGGTEPNPTYALVTSEKTKYRESIEITYDPSEISYE